MYCAYGLNLFCDNELALVNVSCEVTEEVSPHIKSKDKRHKRTQRMLLISVTQASKRGKRGLFSIYRERKVFGFIYYYAHM